MRVLYFSNGFTPHDLRFLTALSKTSHEIFYARLEGNQTGEIPAKVREVKLDCSYLPKPAKFLPAAEAFSKLLTDIKPDIVHAGPLHGAASVAALSGVTPLVSMSWGSDLLYQAQRKKSVRETVDKTLAHSSVLIVDCQAAADTALEYDFPTERIFKFPWGVDLTHFSPKGSSNLRKRLGWQNNTIFLCNRSMEPIYGVDIVVKAFIKAVKETPNLRLMLFGSGSLGPKLHRQIERAGALETVHFGGRATLEELPDIYRSVDVYVSASHSDGSSVSLMEALACGTPALVSNIAGNIEWVQNGIQGWTFEDSNVENLKSEIMLSMMKTENQIMSNNARARAEEKADWSRNFQILLQAYEYAANNTSHTILRGQLRS